MSGVIQVEAPLERGSKRKQVRDIVYRENWKFLENTVEKLFEQVQLNQQERMAICEPGNAAIRGRSGTGKTTCLIMNILLHMLRDVDFSKIETRLTDQEETKEASGSRVSAIKLEIQRVNQKRILLTTTSSSLAN